MELGYKILVQIFSLPILFFVLGITATLVKSGLKVPEAMSRALTIFLLCAIGLKGGVGIAQAGIENLLLPALAAMLLGVGIVLSGYVILIKFKFPIADAGSISGHYGAVAMAAVVMGFVFLNKMEVPCEKFILGVYPFMAISAIVSAIALTHFSLSRYQKGEAPLRGLNILKLCFFNEAIILLIPTLIMGWWVGEEGIKPVMPFFESMFKGVLCLFMLDMGLLVATRLGEWKIVGSRLLAYAVIMPFLHGIVGVLLGTLAGLSVGGATILGIMAGSASFIEAPAAMRVAIPKANPSLPLTASVALTFPLTIIIGIPLYYAVARMWG